MSSIERYTPSIPSNGRLETPRGNLFILLTASVAVNVRVENNGVSEGFNGITGGLRLRRVSPWDNIIITGTAGTTLEYFLGFDLTDEDISDVFLQVTTVAGIITTSESPSSILSTPADNTILAATTENIAANLARKRITIGVLSTETVSLRVQAVGAVDLSGIEIQPGTFAEFKTTASIDIRNNDATVAGSYYILEET